MAKRTACRSEAPVRQPQQSSQEKSWKEMSVAERVDAVIDAAIHDHGNRQPYQPDPEIEMLERMTPQERARYDKRIIHRLQYS